MNAWLRFKPYYIKLVGKGWQDGIGAALAEEVARCNQIMTAAHKSELHRAGE